MFVGDLTGSSIEGELTYGVIYNAEPNHPKSPNLLVVNNFDVQQVYGPGLFKTQAQIRDHRLTELGI